MTIPDSFKGLGIVMGTKQDDAGNVSAEEMAAFKGKGTRKGDGAETKAGKRQMAGLEP